MKKLDKNSLKNIESIKNKTNNNPDIIIKKVSFFDYELYLLYCESMTDRSTINNFILKTLNHNQEHEYVEDIFKYLLEDIPIHKCNEIDNFDDLYYNLYSGYTIILVNGYNKAVTLETKAILNSDINTVQNEKTLKGPKDAFNESYQSNLGLIKKRLKTENILLKEFTVGKVGKSKVAVIAINGIVENETYEHLIQKIQNVDVDVILDGNQLITIIENNEKNVFPNYLSTERPDLVATALLEGKIGIVIENNPYVTLVPTFFEDFFHTPDDLYVQPINASFNRIIRLIAFFITVLTPAIYVAMTTYNHETIPAKLLINFSIQRDGVPFSTVMEALLMTLTFEILKETDTRVPTSIGSSLSIVGALVLGEAAVNAGVFSPIMVIVIALTSISGLIISYTDVSNGIRWWRILFLFAASMAGIIGIVIAGFIFLANITSISSFGKPFMIPYAPLIKENVGNGVILTTFNKFFRRSYTTNKKTKEESKK